MKKIIILIAILMLSVSFSFAQDTERYTIKHLEECNDELSNFGTTFYGENQIIYASPDKKHKIIKNIWDINQQPYLDLFIGDISEDGEIINGKQLIGDVKTKFHEANVVFTKDLKTVYFTRDNFYKNNRRKDNVGTTHLALFKADVIDGYKWENIVAFPFNNKNFSIGHPALSPDDKILYFVSDMPSSIGKTDIYKVNVLENNTYSDPENLGATINTTGREMFAYVSNENILYFSSDGWKGKGELDVFATNLNRNIEKPTNLGAPINSYLDDFAFLINDNNKTGYFSSNRGGGNGDDDIYYFKQNTDVGFDCKQYVKGIITNKDTGRRMSGALVVLYDDKGKELDSKVVGEDARFSFDIDCDSNYKVEGSKYNFTIDSKEFKSNPNLELNLDLKINNKVPEKETVEIVAVNNENLNPYNVPQSYVVKNPNDNVECQNALNNINTIYFDLNKSYIREDAAEELEMVVLIMKRCENIIVEAGSHTDSRASSSYNKSLSNRRAKSTVDFIISRGILPYRIVAKGYGETRLKNHCKNGVVCSEVEHQINRRTRFKILNQ